VSIPPRRALVLSGSIGRGHQVVAEVCADALGAGGMDPSIYDCMALLGPVGSRVAMGAFRMLIARPALYDGFHFAYLRAGHALRRGDRAACRRIADKLATQVEGAELVLSVFATGAAAGAELAGRHPGLKTVVFCTDATVHGMWVHERTHLFLATSDLAARTVGRYRPDAEIALVPPPVRPQFYAPPPKSEARAALGIGDERPCVLLVAGGWGIGPLASAAAALASEGLAVIAVAGTNARLFRELRALEETQRLVHAKGLVDDMASLVAAADVVVSGAGQTCHEVRAVGRPLVLLDVVPGHGRENLLHELTRGGAIGSSPAPERVVRAVEAMLKTPPVLEPWPVRSVEEWQRHFLGALAPLGLSPAG
jgi:processive 1,2-diacylglycerol beta-glucosyltransferase